MSVILFLFFFYYFVLFLIFFSPKTFILWLSPLAALIISFSSLKKRYSFLFVRGGCQGGTRQLKEGTLIILCVLFVGVMKGEGIMMTYPFVIISPSTLEANMFRKA